MLIQATSKLRDELKLKELEQKESSPLFCWHANFLIINRRKTVVLVNDASDYTVILYGMKKDDFNNFPDRVKKGIKKTFERDGIKDSLIEKYLSQFGDFIYQKAKDRSHIARMNYSCKVAKRFDNRFNEKEIYQPQIAKNINTMSRKNDSKDYFYPDEVLKQELAEYFGEEKVIQTEAAVLKVELELGEYQAWRRIIVPLNYSFRELHNIIQKLYNWQDYHLHDFFVYSEEKDESKWLNHSEYHPDGYKAVLNLTMNQENLEYNKYELNYEEEDFELAVENEFKLKDLLPARIKYNYDYGDNWQHFLETEKIIEDYNSNKPTLLDGAGTAPPEDVGGVGGFSEFMQIIANPDHEEYEMMNEWAESQSFKEYDPEEIRTDLRLYID